MRIIDLTQLITPDMPVYPGTLPPRLDPANTYEDSGFRETLLTMYSHTGTHMDAPAHLYADRVPLDDMPASQFAGRALIIDCTDVPAGGKMGMDRIDRVREAADQAEFLVFHTGWAANWNTPKYFGEFPVVTAEVIDYLLSSGKKGIAMDTIGLDPVSDEALTLHHRLLSQADIVIIENLCNLEQCGHELFTFCALPLKFKNADGAPVRAIAMLDN